MQTETNTPVTPTPRVKKVDTAKIAQLSRQISTLDAEIIKLRKEICLSKLILSKKYTLKEVEKPEAKRKRKKVVLSETQLRDLRLKVEQLRFSLTKSENNKVVLREEHTALAIKAREQSSLNREVLTLGFQAERDPMGFIKRTESLLSELAPYVKAELRGLPDRFKTEPSEAKKRLLEIIEHPFPGTYLTLKENSSLSKKFFQIFFEEKPNVQPEVKA